MHVPYISVQGMPIKISVSFY